MKMANARWLAVALLLCGCSPALDWREVTSVEGRYTVVLPDKPRVEERSVATAAGAVDMHLTAAGALGWQFGVAWADYPAVAAFAPEQLIDTQRDALLRNIGGKVLTEKPAPLNGRPGRLVAAEGKSGDTVIALHARFVLDGVRLYQVAATGARGGVDQAGVETFVDSFKLVAR